MPFPFFPGGLILALAVLVGAFVVFGLVLRAMDRAAATLRYSVASGLAAGIREWGHDAAAPPEIDELPVEAVADLERVQRR